MSRKSAYREIGGVRANLRHGFDLRYWGYRFWWNIAPRMHYVRQFPVHIDLELTNRCNLKCVMCPHGYEDESFQKTFQQTLGTMDLALFKQVIDEGVRKGLCSIKLNWRGEPLLAYEIIGEAVRYAKERGVIEVSMNTNGIALDNGLADQLVDAGLDKIIFSVDGATKETYESIRKGGSYEKLLENISYLISVKQKKCSRFPLIRMQMVRMDLNTKEEKEFIEHWKDQVDSISFQDYTSRGETVKRLTEEWGPDGRIACPQIWQRMVITWDGKVVMCCRDWQMEDVLGQLDYAQGQDVESFWKGEKLESIRALHLERKLAEVTSCSHCKQKESYNWVKKTRSTIQDA